ncbi:MAG: histidine--tRNA ligase [Bacillota bacterium]|nr:histidine--tRNA ligase [Bacillota bacterium]
MKRWHRPRGTADILPPESRKWQTIEALARSVAGRYGYEEIRTPTFEYTELFHRGVGDTTDIVQKETYTFEDRGGRSLTLRPEGTAAVMRAYLENGLQGRPQPVKLFYLMSIFRYEKPEAGRLRQHHQFGVEVLGSDHPLWDGEVIALGYRAVRESGLRRLELRLNSIGCPVCRPRYREALLAYYRPLKEKLCRDCQDRLERNPLRLLDCKEDREYAEEAPHSVDYLCEDCRRHHETVKEALAAMEIPYREDFTLVRGLDYYTRTVFEFVHEELGEKTALFGGGRYDGLAEAIGGPPVPGIGFGLGLERWLAALEAEGALRGEEEGPDLFVAAPGTEGLHLLPLMERIRSQGFRVETDYGGRSLKSLMKLADRKKARWVAIVGAEELAEGRFLLRNLESGGQESYPLDMWDDVLTGALRGGVGR